MCTCILSRIRVTYIDPPRTKQSLGIIFVIYSVGLVAGLDALLLGFLVLPVPLVGLAEQEALPATPVSPGGKANKPNRHLPALTGTYRHLSSQRRLVRQKRSLSRYQSMYHPQLPELTVTWEHFVGIPVGFSISPIVKVPSRCIRMATAKPTPLQHTANSELMIAKYHANS